MKSTHSFVGRVFTYLYNVILIDFILLLALTICYENIQRSISITKIRQLFQKKKKRFRQAIILVSPSWLPNLYLAVWFYAYGNRFPMFGILYESCGFVEFQFCTIPHKA